MATIPMGAKVKDKISGIEGKVTARVEHINGCIQYGVQKAWAKGETELHSWNIDEANLEILDKPKKKKVVKRRPGGPTTKV